MAGEKIFSGHIANPQAELELMPSDPGMVFVRSLLPLASNGSPTHGSCSSPLHTARSSLPCPPGDQSLCVRA